MKNAQSTQRAAVRVVIITKHSGYELKCPASAAEQSPRSLIVWSEKKRQKKKEHSKVKTPCLCSFLACGWWQPSQASYSFSWHADTLVKTKPSWNGFTATQQWHSCMPRQNLIGITGKWEQAPLGDRYRTSKDRLRDTYSHCQRGEGCVQ